MPHQLEPLKIDLAAVPQLNLEQYLGLWAIEESAFLQQWEMVRSLDLLSHVASSRVKQQPTKSMIADTNIVQIQIRGTMTKHGSSLSDAGSTVRVRQEIRAAKNDANVDGVLFVVETPGGSVAGTPELANDIWELSQAKPTVTFAEDMMASAGLYAFSQSRKVFANTDGAIVGSMGTYFAMYDRSVEAAQRGIRPVLIRTGDLKGAGFDGMEITDAIKAMWQSVVDESQGGFTAAVQRSRKPTAANLKELSRGGVYSASAAIGMGLIDGICSFDAAVAELHSMIPKKGKGSKMTDSVSGSGPRAATIGELRAACDGADAEFLMKQLEESATIEAAQRAWSRQQSSLILSLQNELKTKTEAHAKQIGELTAEHDKAIKDLSAKHQAEVDRLKQSGGKFAPLADNQSGSGDGGTSAITRWHEAKAALVAKGKTASQAVQILVQTDPELHQSYLAETQAAAKSR